MQSDRITTNRCGHVDDEPIAGLCRNCWRDACKRYSERMAEIPPERKRHALCDHANGYCAA